MPNRPLPEPVQLPDDLVARANEVLTLAGHELRVRAGMTQNDLLVFLQYVTVMQPRTTVEKTAVALDVFAALWPILRGPLTVTDTLPGPIPPPPPPPPGKDPPQ